MKAQKSYELKTINTLLLKSQVVALDSSDLPSPDSCEQPQLLADPDDQVNRPSKWGAFRPVRNGNIKGSIMAMLASAVSTGCLNLPSRAGQLGVVPFLIVLMLCCTFSYCGMDLIKLIVLKYKVQSYGEMVENALGSKIAYYVKFVPIAYTWGLAICFQIIFMKFGVQMLHDVGGLSMYSHRSSQIYNSTGQITRICCGILMVMLNYRYLMMTNLRQVLESVARFSMMGISFTLAIIYLTAFFGFTNQHNGQPVQFQSVFIMDYALVQWLKPISFSYLPVFLQATAAIYFAFLNHQFVFPLISHLKKPTRKRVEYIFFWAHMQEFLIYAALGLLGYLLLAQHRDILPISPIILPSIPTFLVTLGKVMVTAALFFRLPLQLFASKQFLYQVLQLQRNDRNLRKMNIILTGSSLLIAIMFEKVHLYFALIGGSLGVLMGAVIPMACTIKLIEITDRCKKILIFMGVMSGICFLGAVQSVLFPA